VYGGSQKNAQALYQVILKKGQVSWIIYEKQSGRDELVHKLSLEYLRHQRHHIGNHKTPGVRVSTNTINS
jgi:hypothetical protein